MYQKTNTQRKACEENICMRLNQRLWFNIQRFMNRDHIANVNSLAKLSKVPQSTLHQFSKQNHKSINFEHIERLAYVFGTDPMRLFEPPDTPIMSHSLEEIFHVAENLPESMRATILATGKELLKIQAYKDDK